MIVCFAARYLVGLTVVCLLVCIVGFIAADLYLILGDCCVRFGWFDGIGCVVWFIRIKLWVLILVYGLFAVCGFPELLGVGVVLLILIVLCVCLY